GATGVEVQPATSNTGRTSFPSQLSRYLQAAAAALAIKVEPKRFGAFCSARTSVEKVLRLIRICIKLIHFQPSGYF
ncbi:MAG: hypothetical protein ABIR56_03270, partial [Polaromonas sp.]